MKRRPKPYTGSLTATLETHEGAQDGIRFGLVSFSDGSRRHFLHDRLNKTVKLHGFDDSERRVAEDPSAERKAAFLAVVVEEVGS